MQRWVFPLAVALILGAAGWSVYWFLSHAGDPGFDVLAPASTIQELAGGETITTEVNAKAPGFAGTTLDGREVRSIDQIGNKVLLLEFWSVYCTSCVEEMPYLAEIYRRHRDEGLEVVGVCTDFFGPERVRKFLDRLGAPPPYPIVLDRTQQIAKAFKVEQLPVTVLIDSSGWIRMYQLGFKPGNEKEIEKAAVRLLGRIKGTSETVGAVEGRTQVAAAPQRNLAAGEPLPEFAAADMDGVRIESGAWRGDRPLVLFAWSLFCQPCRKEMPYISRRATAAGPDGPRFLSVNVDAERLAAQVGRFLSRNPLPFPTVMDAGADPPGSISARLGIAYTPTLITVGRDGAVRAVLVGNVTEEDLAREIDRVSLPKP